MKFIIHHRPLGKPDMQTGEFELEAQNKTEALSEFYDCHQDLNVHIVRVEVEKTLDKKREVAIM